MTLEADAMTTAPRTPASAPAKTRPFYWSVRREIWENRSLYIAPLVVAAFVLFGYLISAIGIAQRRVWTLALEPARRAQVVAQPYDFAAVAIILTVVLVGGAYCLGALHGERRDRSILFWKSLPVSDLTTVLSKGVVPMVILPIIGAVVIVAVQLIMLLLTAVILLAHGMDPWTPLPLGEMTLVLLYGLATGTLWLAPIYGYLILVSGWARRAPFLWAILPPLALMAVEKLAFNTSHVAALLGDRLFGSKDAYAAPPPHPHVKGEPMIPTVHLDQLTPGAFFASPGFWIGMAVAVACIAAAIWLRRRREPI